MIHFGVYIDQDSVFIGGSPGNWVGVHLDFPWSECCKQFGAPYRAYVHYWPKKCATFKLPFRDNREDLVFVPMGPGRRVRLQNTCAVCHRDTDRSYAFSVDARIRNANGIRREAGSWVFILCPYHQGMANMGKLRVQLVERP